MAFFGKTAAQDGPACCGPVSCDGSASGKVRPAALSAAPLKEALAACRQGFVALFIFSMTINLLLLVSPIYMMQVYDRVLASQSMDTLVLLTIIAMFGFGVLGALARAAHALDQGGDEGRDRDEEEERDDVGRAAHGETDRGNDEHREGNGRDDRRETGAESAVPGGEGDREVVHREDRMIGEQGPDLLSEETGDRNREDGDEIAADGGGPAGRRRSGSLHRQASAV